MADIVVESESTSEEFHVNSPEKRLVSWIIDRVTPWRDYRDQNFKDSWDEYYRIWRGKWTELDKTRNSERSRLISPATAQAIEVATAEVEEAVFGKGKWFDINDDVLDQDKKDAGIVRQLLEEDLEDTKTENAMSETFLLGAIYGTGIAKIVIEEETQKTISPNRISDQITSADVVEEKEIKNYLVPIPPEKFLIDSYATSIDEAMGCAHEDWIPKHIILDKQARGIYRPGFIGQTGDKEDYSAKGETSPDNRGDNTKVLEYHGLVPQAFLDAVNGGEEDDSLLLDKESYDDLEDSDLVEAIVTIANDSVVLRAVENKLIMKDRGFIAFQFDTVPNRFWGRGIAEKGYNAQKALDAELRGRIDAMALTISPMMGVDATRLIKGTNLEVKAGKSILTSGNPSEVLMPFKFGQVTGETFSQSGELERMIQMATGAMDSAAPVGVSPRNSTASGMSMIMSGAIKRSKRTLSNIETNFIIPMLHKMLWRYQQFDSKRYPIVDLKFRIVGSLGIMARELEQQNLANMLKTVSPDTPAYWMLIRNMYQLSSLDNKEEMIQITDQMIQNMMKPDPVQEAMKQIQVQAAQKEVEKVQSEVVLNLAKARSEASNSGEGDIVKAQLDAQLEARIAEMKDQTEMKKALIEADTKLKIAHINAEVNREVKTQQKESAKK